MDSLDFIDTTITTGPYLINYFIIDEEILLFHFDELVPLDFYSLKSFVEFI